MKNIEIIGTGIEVTPQEANELINLFEHPGWAVLQKVREIEKDAALMCGMAINSDEMKRAENRAIYHKLLADEQFPDAVRESLEALVNKAK